MMLITNVPWYIRVPSSSPEVDATSWPGPKWTSPCIGAASCGKQGKISEGLDCFFSTSRFPHNHTPWGCQCARIHPIHSCSYPSSGHRARSFDHHGRFQARIQLVQGRGSECQTPRHSQPHWSVHSASSVSAATV